MEEHCSQNFQTHTYVSSRKAACVSPIPELIISRFYMYIRTYVCIFYFPLT